LLGKYPPEIYGGLMNCLQLMSEILA